MTAPLRAVIADDSALYRAVLARAFASLGGIELLAQAADGSEALALVKKHQPDFLTLDLNMPRLDGLGTLRALRDAKLQCEVLVVSSETRQGATTTLEALQLGAVDFITKPNQENAHTSIEVLVAELRRQLSAIRLRRDTRLRRLEQRDHAPKLAASETALVAACAPRASSFAPKLVTIGTSTGGPSALPVLLGAIPADFPLPILIVQHMPPLFTASLAESLDRRCALHVHEGRNGQWVKPGHAYIAPGGHHMQVERASDKGIRLAVTDDPPENHCRPSVDVLFRSAALEYPGRVIAAILTGMGNDGVAGLSQLKASGALVIAQNEASCTVFGMPQEAIRAGVVDSILPIDKIASAIVDATRPHGA